MSDPEKIYWSTKEVAQRVGVPESTVRYWCSIFGDVRKRGLREVRYFAKDEVERIEEINRLLNVEKFTIEGAKLKLK